MRLSWNERFIREVYDGTVAYLIPMRHTLTYKLVYRLFLWNHYFQHQKLLVLSPKMTKSITEITFKDDLKTFKADYVMLG